VIYERCGPLRRRLGPVAWTVLEELVLIGDIRDGVLVADVSVRGLASRLGLSKDTVNRATIRLRRAGLLVLDGVEHDQRGRFSASSYRVDPARLAMRRFDAAPFRLAVPPTRSRRVSLTDAQRRDTSSSATQLTLLEAD
jgi:hypothetical protein